jgi:hypothetical protein
MGSWPNASKAATLEAWLSGETVKVLLLDDSTTFTFDEDNDDTVSDVLATGTEMSGTGYSRQTLSSLNFTADDTDNEGVFDADNTTWSGLDAGTITDIVVYKQVGGDDTTPSDDEIVAVIEEGDIGSLPLTTNGSDVTINWAAEGILNIS